MPGDSISAQAGLVSAAAGGLRCVFSPAHSPARTVAGY